MYRRTLRSRRSVVRWARETTLVAQTTNAIQPKATFNFVAVPSVPGQGNRKVRAITLKINSSFNIPLPVAVVFVPSGTVPGEIGSGSVASIQPAGSSSPITGTLSSFYEPNQNVLAVGQVPANNSETVTIYYSGTRNLGSGDCIAVVMKNFGAAQVQGNLLCSVSYLIGY